jgi:dTDP-glucose pyrophosphorylase/drug/metabolite transporter (DMT)-like permease
MDEPSSPNTLYEHGLAHLINGAPNEFVAHERSIVLNSPRIPRALISTVAGREELNTTECPKTLIQIEGRSILFHQIRQLFLAGIREVVVLTAPNSTRILCEVRDIVESGKFAGMSIRTHKVAQNSCRSLALSILGSQGVFRKENFLLVTSDHIHSHKLIAEMANFDLEGSGMSAAILVDECAGSKRLTSNDVGEMAVLVRTFIDDSPSLGKCVRHVGRVPLPGANAIEAGLTVCDFGIFAALQQLASTENYLSLCEALQMLALQGKLRSIATNGRPWFAVETIDQLEIAANGQQEGFLFPWQALVASHVPSSPSCPPAMNFLCDATGDIKEISVLTRTESCKSFENIEAKEITVKSAVSHSIPFIGWFMLFGAAIGSSSMGALFDMLSGVEPLLKNMWRTQVLLCILIPLNLYNHRDTSVIEWAKNNITLFTFRHLIQVLLSYMYMTVVFAQSLAYTSVGHLYLFAGCTSLILVLLRLGSGEKFSSLTLVSVLVAIGGAAVCMLWGGAASEGDNPIQEHPSSIFGDLLAFTLSISGVFFYGSTKVLRKKNWDVLTIYLLQQIFLFSVFWIFLSCGILVEFRPTMDLHPIHGMFGWLTRSNLPIISLVILNVDIFGVIGYMAVLKYFDPIVVSVITLLEPLISIIIGNALGVAPVPSIGTWVGGLMMIIGAMGVSPTVQSKETVDVSDAIFASSDPLTEEKTKLHNNGPGWGKYGTFNSRDERVDEVNITVDEDIAYTSTFLTFSTRPISKSP